jgi:electron transport complex protein RnfG
MKINKEIIKLGVTLMIITILSTLALSLTNELTKNKIVEQLDANVLYSLAEIFPEADDFKEMDGYYDAYINGNVIGKVLEVSAPGYSSVIQLLAGVDLENKITKVIVLSQLETPGLGANVQKSSFLDQFSGKTMDQVRLTKDGGNIDGITGATISSRAVTDGVRETLQNYLAKVN